MSTPQQIDPAKAVPQAPRVLRAGSKGHARAKAAEAAGQPVPAAQADDDEDDDDPEDPKNPDEDDDEDMAACAEACRTASDACSRAQEQLDACATECEGGTDSVTTLTNTEAACDEAIEELQEAKARCATLRGVEPDAQPEPAPAPSAPMNARALAKAAPAPTVEAHLETARLAEFGRFALQQLGETDIPRARGALTAALEGAQTAENATEQATTARVAEAWNAAIRRGAYTAGQVREQVERKGKRASRYTAFAASINARHPDPAELEAYLERAPKLASRERGAPADADLAGANGAANAQAAADTMSPATAALAQRNKIEPTALARMTATLFAHLSPGA